MVLPGPVRRGLLRLSATQVGARVLRTVLPPLDRLVHRLTGGRHTVTELVAPATLVLTTTGRRTGLPRAQPLLYVETGDGWAVVGTNWGQEDHPAWTNNLLAEPRATVAAPGRAPVPVLARLAEGEERALLWARFERLVPNYRRYEQRISGRAIRLFVLDPDDAGTDPRGSP